jgi:hypothetical protein
MTDKNVRNVVNAIFLHSANKTYYIRLNGDETDRYTKHESS